MKALDLVYMTRARALALGATHEGTHFGVPHWVWLDERDPDGMQACPKLALLEPWVTLCCLAHAFLNRFRADADQADFKFLVKPIGEGAAS